MTCAGRFLSQYRSKIVRSDGFGYDNSFFGVDSMLISSFSSVVTDDTSPNDVWSLQDSEQMVIWSSGGRLINVTTFSNTGGSSSWQSWSTPVSKLVARMAASSKNWTMPSRRDETDSCDDNSHILRWQEVVDLFSLHSNVCKADNTDQGNIWFALQHPSIISKANYTLCFAFVTTAEGTVLPNRNYTRHTQKSLGFSLAFPPDGMSLFRDNHASKICLQLNRVSFLASKKYRWVVGNEPIRKIWPFLASFSVLCCSKRIQYRINNEIRTPSERETNRQ